MEKLLFGLTPGEFWVWNYLVMLARRQGSTHIILPRPGEDKQLEEVYSRKHLKRILKSLKGKRTLTHIIIPVSKSKQIELFLPASSIADVGVPNTEKGYMGVCKKEGMAAPVSPIKGLGTSTSPISNGEQRTLPGSGDSKLELNKLEQLLKQKQGQLKKELQATSPRELVEIGKILKRICRYEARGNKLSLQAKVYGAIRFLQEGEAITKPQAWIDTVARQAERDFQEERCAKDACFRDANMIGTGARCANSAE